MAKFNTNLYIETNAKPIIRVLEDMFSDAMDLHLSSKHFADTTDGSDSTENRKKLLEAMTKMREAKELLESIS